MNYHSSKASGVKVHIRQFFTFALTLCIDASKSNYDSRYRDPNRDRDRNRRESKDFDPDSDSDFDFDCTDVP
jgi:hypothetical protein